MQFKDVPRRLFNIIKTFLMSYALPRHLNVYPFNSSEPTYDGTEWPKSIAL